MLQGALIKFAKTVFLQKNCYRNGLIMCIVVHEARRQKQVWIKIKNKKKKIKAIEQELGCKFIRIDPDKEDFDIFRAINEIFGHMKQSTKKTITDKISATKFIVRKKYMLIISNNGNLLCQL